MFEGIWVIATQEMLFIQCQQKYARQLISFDETRYENEVYIWW